MSLKVLLADDSMTAQNMAKKILADSGYEVTTVSNGAAAVKKIAEVKPDLVILDIYMPGYTGLEVCERVRANLETTNLPVLLTVGKMEPYRAEDGARVRADGIIVKPFEATDLINIVKKISDKFSPTKAPNYGEYAQTASMPAPVVEEFSDNGFEEAHPTAQVEVPSEMASAPVMSFDESPSTAPMAVEWAPSAGAMDPAMEFPAVMPADPAEPEHAPISFMPAHSEAEPGVTTDSMPAYAEPDAPTAFAMGPVSTGEAGPPATEIEFNSAPQAKDVNVEMAADLEPTIRTDNVEVFGAQDPALVTSHEELAKFTTSFGVENAEVIPVGTVTGDEAFLAEPSVHDMPEPLAPEQVFGTAPAETMDTVAPAEEEHPVEAFEAHAVERFEAHPVEAAPAEPEAEHTPTPSGAPTDDFEARVAAAMSAFDQPIEEPAGPAGGAVEQVDNFIGDPEIVNPSAVQAEPAPEPEPVAQSRRTLDVNETMVLPAEALLSLEAEMRKAMELKMAEPSSPNHEQVMDDFTGPQHEEGMAEKTQKSEAFELPQPVESVLPQESHGFVGHAEPEAQPEHVEEAHPLPSLAQAAAAAVPEVAHGFGDETVAIAIKKAVERLQPQLIAEIMKALKGE